MGNGVRSADSRVLHGSGAPGYAVTIAAGMNSAQPPTTYSGLPKRPQGSFATTLWTVVLEAGSGVNDPRAAAALEQLCTHYWSPIYTFALRLSGDRHEAEDLTQAFFAHLLETDAFKKADQQRGRFRSFLLAALRNFIANEWARRDRQKRGGKNKMISLEIASDTGELELQLAPHLSPEAQFDRGWALAVVNRVLVRLRREFRAAGKARLYARLEKVMTGEIPDGFYAACEAELGMSERALHVALHRLRRRFGQLLRREVAHTVSRPAEIEDEIRYLFTLL